MKTKAFLIAERPDSQGQQRFQNHGGDREKGVREPESSDRGHHLAFLHPWRVRQDYRSFRRYGDYRLSHIPRLYPSLYFGQCGL